MKFHEKLLVLRKKAGMTQLDLAEKLNVSRQAVSRWEMGTAMPEIENLIAMSDLFGVSLDYMLKQEEAEEHVEAAEECSQSGKESKHRWDRNWPYLMMIVYIIFYLFVAVVNLDPTGAMIIAAIPVAIIWALKIMICWVVHFLRR